MSTKFHPDDGIIQGIGPKLVRTTFGLTPQRLYAWRIRGVPYTHKAAIAQLATLHGKQVPSDFLAPPVEKAA